MNDGVAEGGGAAVVRPSATTGPYIGVVAVLLGAIVSTLAGRLTSFGLADVRGAVHAGFDEGAWIPTAFAVGQMLSGPLAIWLAIVFGPQRVLMSSAVAFALANLLIPYTIDLWPILALQSVSGLASGTFIPITI